MFVQLIPLKPNCLLPCRKSKFNALTLLLNIVNESIEACEAFLDKKYTAFDAQVGETSCQIRAYKICLLAHNGQFIVEIQKLIPRIVEYRKNIIKCIKEFEASVRIHTKYFKDLDQKDSKEDFFNRLRIILPLKEDYLFIILSHFLNKYCLFDNDDAPHAIDYNLIKSALNIGSTPARHLANRYQSFLSRLSCEFILQQSTYPDKMDMNFLHKLLKIGDKKRYALPYYYVTKILLLSVNTRNLPIILSIYNSGQNKFPPQILFFKKNHFTNKITLHSELNNVDKHTPAIIFRGDVLESERLSFNDFKNHILQTDLQKIILLNAATHPQYTGEILNNYAIDPYKDIAPVDQELEKIIAFHKEELNQARMQSERVGCSQNNFTLFYVKHIFCSTFYEEQSTFL